MIWKSNSHLYVGFYFGLRLNSGLRINLKKSVIMQVGEVVNVEQLALDLGCNLGTLPTTYLGLPLGSRQASINIWDGVEEKFRRKLAIWKK